MKKRTNLILLPILIVLLLMLAFVVSRNLRLSRMTETAAGGESAPADEEVQPAPAADDLRTYDLQGRRVLTTSAKAPALLIRGGKKFIVRP